MGLEITRKRCLMTKRPEKVVLLAGGLGTRLREETEYRPKPMVEIGGKPILWHIMKTYASFGFKDFVICAGYKGNVIKDYFLRYQAYSSDFTITLGKEDSLVFHGDHDDSDWNVTIADTGLSTQTAGRIKRVQKYIGNNRFLCTYGDGVADIDLDALLESHQRSGRLATLTAVNPPTRFGVIEIEPDSKISDFKEKPSMSGWINAGFFVFEPKVFDYLVADEALESSPLKNLAKGDNLNAYKHSGFWQPMDTYREFEILNSLWNEGAAPWATKSNGEN